MTAARPAMTVAMAARQKKRRRGLSPPEGEGGEVCVVSLMAAAPFPERVVEHVSRRRYVSAGLMKRLSPAGKVRESWALLVALIWPPMAPAAEKIKVRIPSAA